MTQVNIAADIRIDPIMYSSCENIITARCSDIKPGNGRLIDCLSSSINSEDMTNECRSRLLDISFFKSRDWSLSPKLYNYCRKDAIKFCNAKSEWFQGADEKTLNNHQKTLPCLFNYHMIKHKYKSDQVNNFQFNWYCHNVGPK